jgi:hypothetical protein
MSGTSLRHDPGFRTVTMADLRGPLAGMCAALAAVLDCGTPAGERATSDSSSISAAALSSARRRLFFTVTSAGPSVATGFRFPAGACSGTCW